MSTHRYIDRICAAGMILSVILTVLFVNSAALGVQAVSKSLGYESRLFDTSRVHTIDIVMDGWDSFIEDCEKEEYVTAAVVIDGEAYQNIGIRAKGNTSLSTVSSMNSDRYSFKIEFDQYDSGKSYYGLDKLSLNNLIQDTTYMKDYLTYRLMGSFGVNAPLCSYAYITVNGEEWGLYLAVEGVEDGFLQRNYGSSYGELYKPDSTGFGGGRGNGRDFDIQNWDGELDDGERPGDSFRLEDAGGADTGFEPEGDFKPPEEGWREDNGFQSEDDRRAENGDNDSPENKGGEENDGLPDDSERPGRPGNPAAFGGGFAPGGIGSDDVKLKYIDDNTESYANIFNNAKTDIDSADKRCLIESLKKLKEGEDIESAVNVDKVIRYFVVHNFVVNSDSYTGEMVHNYYLYEEGGRLSMIPWDYNLAFGTFQGGDAQRAVNDPVDTPLSVTGSGDRPMADWIFSNDEYIQLYHQYFSEFLKDTDIEGLIDRTEELIAAYVEKDPTAFYSYDEFETGVAALREFCLLRTRSVLGQLEGTVPATADGQSANPSALISTGQLALSDMGTMERGGKEGAMERDGMEKAGMERDDMGRGGMEKNGGDKEEEFSFGGEAPAYDDWMRNREFSGNGINNILLIPISVLVLFLGLGVAVKIKH